MEHTQLELDFCSPQEVMSQATNVVSLLPFAEIRAKRAQELEKAQLLAEIIRSVEHITGRSPDAEAM